ncbi:polysaccharide lyase 8 family protein [Weeksellaceae bacterium TAE3-ERU29]|nr:polysaccharide lyase 8 family protein [Weeksellaceae bacterium TAE3-ERU29]
MEKRGYIRILVIILFFASISIGYTQDFKVIRDRIAQGVVSEKGRYANKNRIKEYMDKMNDGAFNDVDYKDTTDTNWKPIEHLKRLELLAIAYTTEGNQYYKNPELLKKIEKGLKFWAKAHPKSTNWWHNDINAPKQLGRVLIVMSTALGSINQTVIDECLSQMKDTRSADEMTGANKVDIAIQNIYRAAISEDAPLMEKSVEYVYEPIALTLEDEGIQYDYSYFQHGPQLHISSYGSEFIKGAYTTAYWFVGTPYALPKEKAAILNKYFFDTYVSGIRGRNMDFNLEGRGISRQDALDKGWIADFKNEDNLLSKIALVAGSAYSKKVEDLKKRLTDYNAVGEGITPEHIYFWKADYTIHKRPEYSFNVRAVSPRTRRTERGNNENLLGRVLPDGSTNIQVYGGEYRNIMPFWEWDKIPGVTARDYDEDKEITINWGKEAGTSSFVGGVSDGVYGATVYTQDYDGVKAKKSYFFFDDAVVCLGSDITSKEKENITTTVNQTYSRGDIYGLQNGQITSITNEGNITADAIWHNDIGYVFPKKTKLELSNKNQRGSWGQINKRFPLTELEDKIFKLWINQGVSPTNATYEYIVLPGISKDELVNNYANQYIKVLENNGKIQAVEDTKLNITQAVFFEPGTLAWGKDKVIVDKPCILQLRELPNKSTVISVADPNQTETEVNITYIKSGKDHKLNIQFPNAPYRGQTVQRTF